MTPLTFDQSEGKKLFHTDTHEQYFLALLQEQGLQKLHKTLKDSLVDNIYNSLLLIHLYGILQYKATFFMEIILFSGSV